MAGGRRRRTVVVQSTKELHMTTISHTAPAIARRTTSLTGVAGIVAGPFFLGLILLNTWLSRDFLHSIGWKLVGGKSVPYPSCFTLGPPGWLQVGSFFFTGLLVIAFALGLRRVLPRRRLSTAGVALLTAFGAALAASSSKTDW